MMTEKQNLKIKVIYILMLTLISSILLISNADVIVPENIRVGLLYDSSAVDNISIEVPHGFSFGQIIYDQYNEIYNLAEFKKLDIYSNSNYHIQIGSTYGDMNSFSTFRNQVLSSFNDVFSGYEMGWRLYYGNFSSKGEAQNYITKLRNENPNFEYNLVEPETNKVILFNGSYPVFMYNSNEADYVLKDLSYDGSPEYFELNNKKYRNGVIIRRLTAGKLTVINSLTMQEYLYGVLPREMAKDWPIEALKAQAVAARNYAMLSMGKHNNNGFDICPTVHCQVYGGYTYEGPISNSAVDSTKGILLFHDTNIVQAFYHSNSGGQTENSENIWSSTIPYIKGINDPFSSNAPNSNWSVSLSKTDIRNSLSAYGYNVGEVKSVDIIDSSLNGRVQQLRITGTTGSVVLKKEETRKIFGYSTIKSMWFSFSKSSNVTILTSRGRESTNNSKISIFNGVDSSSIDVSAMNVYNGKLLNKITTQVPTSRSSDSVTFYGHGYGHGLGMSQWGAKEMAEQGYGFEQILKHYYKDTYVK